MTSPTDPTATVLRYARARLAVLRHVRDELEITDPRTLNGKEDHDIIRAAIGVQLVVLDDQIAVAHRALDALGPLTP